MNQEQTISQQSIFISDNAQNADGVVALAGTGTAMVLLLGAIALLTPATMMMVG